MFHGALPQGQPYIMVSAGAQPPQVRVPFFLCIKGAVMDLPAVYSKWFMHSCYTQRALDLQCLVAGLDPCDALKLDDHVWGAHDGARPPHVPAHGPRRQRP